MSLSFQHSIHESGKNNDELQEYERIPGLDPGRRPAFRESHHVGIFLLLVSHNHENHSTPMQSAADLEVPGEF